MLLHVVEVHNSVTVISAGTLNSKMMTIALTRHAGPLLTHVVHIDLSSMSASPEMGRHVIHEVGQIVLQHAMMMPRAHDIVSSSLRGTTNTSITKLHLAQGMLKNAPSAAPESATRLQNVM